MQYSIYQNEIFKAVENGKSNIAINAVAGSGKTTTIVEACKRLKLGEKDVKFLAFNKAIVKDLTDKLAGFAEVNTLHSFGFAVLRAVYGNQRGKRLDVKPDKWANYLKGHVYDLSSIITPDTPAPKVYGFRANVCKLFDLARYNLVQAGNTKLLQDIADEHNMHLLADEIRVCDILLADAYEMPADLKIDYTDMVVLPLVCCKDRIPTYKYVFIDEAQDLNTAQRELMLCAAAGGRFIAVGDRKQAINGFAGADCASFDKIASLPNTIELPLSVNYRCGSNMIRLAQQIVPQIVAHEGAIEGEVNHVNKLTKSLFKANDMVLCRTTAPLVGLCMSLVASGITAIVKGKDIAAGLKNLVDNANTTDIDTLLDYLENEKKKLVAVIKRERKCDENDAKESARYRNFEDRCKCIENICLHSISGTSELKAYIERIFSDENVSNAVVLSSAHKSKGLEADRVLIILPEKLPLVWRNQKEWQYEQEMNLKYVALTRAKKELIFVDIDEKHLAGSPIEND